MSRLVALEWMSLDGVVQAPSYPDEDTSGGFRHGGWHAPFFDAQSLAWVTGSIEEAEAYLLGRGTYEIFAAHWPNASPAEQPLAEPLNSRPKYVASSTLTDDLTWTGTTRIAGDLADAITDLKQTMSGALALIGSPRLAQSLIAHDLLDELRIMIDPILIGDGKRLFATHDQPQRFTLTDCQQTSTGAILATYRRHGDPSYLRPESRPLASST
jgi:dihydrofolate reductase